MKIMGRRRNQDDTKKIEVNILGRGSEKVTTPQDVTVGNLRKSLDIPGNVKALDGVGNELGNKSKLEGLKEINFVPNVQGG